MFWGLKVGTQAEVPIGPGKNAPWHSYPQNIPLPLAIYNGGRRVAIHHDSDVV